MPSGSLEIVWARAAAASSELTRKGAANFGELIFHNTSLSPRSSAFSADSAERVGLSFSAHESGRCFPCPLHRAPAVVSAHADDADHARARHWWIHRLAPAGMGQQGL